MNEVIEKNSMEMSLSEIRRAICGDMVFTLVIDPAKKIEMRMKELDQATMNGIDNEIFKRNIDPQKNYKEYDNAIKVLKLATAYIDLYIDGKVILMKNEADMVVTEPNDKIHAVEALLRTLGEGVISGLAVQYDNIIIEKFANVQKKTILKAE